jgi:hypothetical protein
MPQCYPGEHCTSEGQKTHPGSSGRPHLPRGHNAVPQLKRLHLFHRAVSYHYTASHCSVGNFSGNCNLREPSLKSTHGPNPEAVRRGAPIRCGSTLENSCTRLGCASKNWASERDPWREACIVNRPTRAVWRDAATKLVQVSKESLELARVLGAPSILDIAQSTATRMKEYRTLGFVISGD